jgi:hypothetical protein
MLLGEQNYKEAGVIFSRSNCYAQAIEAFKRVGDWQNVLILLPKMQLRYFSVKLYMWLSKSKGNK